MDKRKFAKMLLEILVFFMVIFALAFILTGIACLYLTMVSKGFYTLVVTTVVALFQLPWIMSLLRSVKTKDRSKIADNAKVCILVLPILILCVVHIIKYTPTFVRETSSEERDYFIKEAEMLSNQIVDLNGEKFATFDFSGATLEGAYDVCVGYRIMLSARDIATLIVQKENFVSCQPKVLYTELEDVIIDEYNSLVKSLTDIDESITYDEVKFEQYRLNFFNEIQSVYRHNGTTVVLSICGYLICISLILNYIIRTVVCLCFKQSVFWFPRRKKNESLG